MCSDGKHLLRQLVELDISHNKYITNDCVEKLIKTVCKIRRIKAPLRLYLSQTSAQSEYLEGIATKRVDLIF
jgi:hypothetical protein